MSRAFALCAIICFVSMLSCKKQPGETPVNPATDSFNVIVNNGYGSGKYRVGDTVHIFTSHYGVSQLFEKWSGDISLLDAPEEWHTWFIMPEKNVTVTGSVKNINPFNLQYEMIKGKDRPKPVYYYLKGSNKGVVYLLHGSGGSAASVAYGDEFQQLIKSLVDDNYGVVITEAEESTTGVDANADGKIRWAILPMDTLTNVEYANIRAISDTFYNRGLMNRSTPRYAVGMSNGGFFSQALSYMFNFKAEVCYCAQGSANLIALTSVPTLFCMAANDNNESVGAAGNAAALDYSKSLIARGVCSKYLVKQRSPIYPERFALTGEISLAQSVAVFNELQSKGYIDSKKYWIGYSDKFVNDLKASPALFPVVSSLSLSQKTAVLGQINLSVADHHMYSDYDAATLHFLNSQCN